MSGEAKYQQLTNDYAIQFSKTQNQIILLFVIYNNYTVQKYNTKIEHKVTSPLLDQLGTIDELFQFIKNQENYEFQTDSFQFIIKWKIIGANFQKNVQYKLKLSQALLTEIETLKFENILLKRRLISYQQKVNKNSESIEKQFKKIGQINQKNHHSSDTVQNQLIKVSPINQQILIDSQSYEYNYKQGKSLLSQKKTKPIRKNQRKHISKHQNQNQNCQRKIKNSKKVHRNQSEGSQQLLKNKDKDFKQSNKVKISFANGDYYFGEVKNNLYHGHGLYYSLTNGTFEGIWENGKANGYGVSLDSFGNRHSGQYKNGSRNGKGIDEYINGEKYEGNFENDSKFGLGKYTYKNGDFYEGEWQNDMYNGYGKQVYHDGTSFEGKWSNDEKDGQGIFKDKQGIKWQQVWNKGTKILQKKID